VETKLDLRSEQKEERRRRILDAARQIIAERGYESLTMRDLAAASRVTVPTIYNLVGSKEAVLSSAVSERTAGFIAGIASAETKTAASGILSVVEANCTELLRLPDYYQSLLRLLLSSPQGRDMREGVTTAVTESFQRGLEQMRTAGELADWADIPALAGRLRSHLQITALDWAAGNFDNEALRACSLLGTSMMILGVASGESRRELEECARSVQAEADPRQSSTPALEPATS
jgi:AcrR family transcriptional regulator